MSLTREAPLGVKLLLFAIFLVGIVAFGFVLIDAGWTRLMLQPKPAVSLPAASRAPGNAGAIAPSGSGSLSPLGTPVERVPGQSSRETGPAPAVSAAAPPPQAASPQQPVAAQQAPSGNLLDAVRKSIVLVASSQCRGSAGGHGTGFVVKTGYVATNAHVVDKCRNIVLLDYQGRQLKATVKGAGQPGTAQDLAVLSYNDEQSSLPPLPLAAPSEGKAGDKIQTVGYPLVAVESGQNSPSPSNEGVIASYDINAKLYYSQGMNINPGNSGGPVFLLADRKVVGVAMAKSVNMQLAEGVGVCIPSATLREFFKQHVGESLP